MKAPTYPEQEKLIHEAYINDEIKPMDCNFCFCGTISPNGRGWHNSFDKNYSKIHFYTNNEYLLMEDALFAGIHQTMGMINVYVRNIPVTEDALFNGMVRALEVLRAIHVKKGEVIDFQPTFSKRKINNLCPTDFHH